MRQSIAPSRTTQVASLAHSNNAAAMSRLQEKKKEFEAVAALERASALFLKRIEGLADDCEVMADAGQGLFITQTLIFPHHRF
jgi:DASH complex subunit DAD2